MQSDYKQIYKMAAEKTGEPEQLYKDMGNFIFAQLYKKLRKPEALILRLKGVGQWYLRKRRMEIVVNNYPPPDPATVTQEEYDERVEFLNRFKDRLKDYDKFVELKHKIRKIRHETQTLISRETSEDNL